MIIPRALITLALCFSAVAITSPTPTINDETLIARQPNEGGHNEGHRGGHRGSHNPRPSPSHGFSNPQRRTVPSHTKTATEIAEEICPGEFYGCPIADAGSLTSLPASLSDWISGGYECIDPKADLTACGGCASLDAKHDCTLITGANGISCVVGACVVDSCVDGYELDVATNTCIITVV